MMFCETHALYDRTITVVRLYSTVLRHGQARSRPAIVVGASNRVSSKPPPAAPRALNGGMSNRWPARRDSLTAESTWCYTNVQFEDWPGSVMESPSR